MAHRELRDPPWVPSVRKGLKDRRSVPKELKGRQVQIHQGLKELKVLQDPKVIKVLLVLRVTKGLKDSQGLLVTLTF